MLVVLLVNTRQVFNFLLMLLEQPHLELVQRSVSQGSNIDTTDGTTANTVSAGTITNGVYSPGTIAATQDTPGAAFSFSQSYTQADAIPTSAPSVGTVGNLTGQTSYASGTAGDLAGTVTSANVLTVTAGGAGSTAIGQFVSEITVID